MAHSLTSHTISAKFRTQNYHFSVCFGKASFADSGKNCAKHLHKAYLINNLIFSCGCSFGEVLKDHHDKFTFFVNYNIML